MRNGEIENREEAKVLQANRDQCAMAHSSMAPNGAGCALVGCNNVSPINPILAETDGHAPRLQ